MMNPYFESLFFSQGGRSGFIPEIETKSTEEIKKFQEIRLKEALVYLSENSPYYRRRFREVGVQIETIRILEDLIRLPLTTKEDLQRYNMDFIACDRAKLIDYVSTSGTLGPAVTFALSAHDLERLAYCEYISFCCAGATTNQVFQLTTTLDRRFMAGMAYFLGIKKLGAGVIRLGSGFPHMQWDTIQKMRPNALIAVPSFINKMLEFAISQGIEFQQSSIESAICIGEPIRNADFTYNTLGKQITETWGIKLYATYAATELEGGFTECEHGVGGHHHPELHIIELLDELGNPVKEGETGELVVTTLGIEGMPLLRFQTGDITSFHSEPCPCGRNTIRLGPILGRKKQMIKYKGTSLYPQAVFDVLNSIPGIHSYVLELYSNSLGTDEITIHLAVDPDTEDLTEIIQDHFRTRIRVLPQLKFHSSEQLNRMQFPGANRKAITLIDNRMNNL